MFIDSICYGVYTIDMFPGKVGIAGINNQIVKRSIAILWTEGGLG